MVLRCAEPESRPRKVWPGSTGPRFYWTPVLLDKDAFYSVKTPFAQPEGEGSFEHAYRFFTATP